MPPLCLGYLTDPFRRFEIEGRSIYRSGTESVLLFPPPDRTTHIAGLVLALEGLGVF